MVMSMSELQPKHEHKFASNFTGEFANDHARWEAVVQRDRRADGVFYYSVKTTGVYCVPSCASRQARREHVRFHATLASAERAGYRACKRCRPDDVHLDRMDRKTEAVVKACCMIDQTEGPVDLEALAQAVGMSKFYFHRVFKAMTGLTPRLYVQGQRAWRVQKELSRRSTVTDALYRSGYNTSGRFYAQSDATLGMSPTTYRNGGDGISIRFAVGQCSLGAILVAATKVGICTILLGDHPDALLRDLQDRFSQATLVAGDAGFEQWVAQVVGMVECPQSGLALPLDVQGTAFQQRVWLALREIPCGQTVSYAELATRIGSPRGARAVAKACAANPIAVAIPCHRVVRKDKQLTGYRWGIDRKRILLEREAQQDD